MTAFASVAGLRVIGARAELPSSGIWTADVELDTPAELRGRVELAIAGLVLRGTAELGGPYQGAASYRIVGGAGGWRKRLPAKAYRDAVGVRLSTVAGDAARAAGEELAPITDRVVGQAWVRAAGPGSRVLDLLQGRAWRMGNDGVTTFAEPPAGDVAVAYDVVSVSRSRRVVKLATEAPEGFPVGATLRAGVPVSLVIAQVHIDLSSSGLRLTVWGREIP